jgi:hypothetical protein
MIKTNGTRDSIDTVPRSVGVSMLPQTVIIGAFAEPSVPAEATA